MLKIRNDYKSPNFANELITPKYVVLHSMCHQDIEALEFLCAKENGVSAHYFIARNGDVYNLVDDNKKAWHAGYSCWKGQEFLNPNSIGIELGNTGVEGNEDGYTDQQYDSLILLLKYIKKRYNIKPENIIAHSDIAPERKTDPGAKFNWDLLIENNLAVGFSRLINISNYMDNIISFGYDFKYNEKKVIEAFQRRFLPNNITGKLDQKTKFFINNSKVKA